MRQIDQKPKRNILRSAAVRDRTGLSGPTIWRYERDGKFPKRIALDDAGRMVGWFEEEVDKWVHDRVRGAGKRPTGVAPAKPGKALPAANDAAD